MDEKSEGIHIQGFVDIEIVNKTTGKTRLVRKNTITDIGKLMMLCRGANSFLMECSGTPYGRLECVDMLGTHDQNTLGHSANYFTYQDNGLTNYLLSTSADLTSASKLLPIFDTAMAIDYTKLIGYANTRNVSGNIHQGILEYTKGTYMLDECVANRWKYDINVATGTFNHIAMGAGVIGTLPCNGMFIKKCITKLNYFEAGVSFGDRFIIPGAGNITSANEILLLHTSGDETRWKYNLITGEMTVVPEIGVARDALMYEARDQIVLDVGGTVYLFALDYTTGYLRKIDTTDGTTLVSLNLFAVLGSTPYGCGVSMYYESGTGYIYVISSAQYNDNPDYDNYAKIYTINPATMALVGSAANKRANTSWINNIPSSWYRQRITVRKVSTYYYVNCMAETIKCTSLTDVVGTMVSVYLSYPFITYFLHGTDIYSLEVGANHIDYDSMESSKFSPYGSLYRPYYGRVKKNGTTTVDLNMQFNGIWLSKDYSGQIISYVKIDPPIVKAADDIIYVSYGYKFV